MIHSMSGGVIKDAGSYTFVKVRFDDDGVAWYITDFDVTEGDRLKARRGIQNVGTSATAVKVEYNVNGQVAPVPLKRVKKLICKL